jgi:hypothetical protein
VNVKDTAAAAAGVAGTRERAKPRCMQDLEGPGKAWRRVRCCNGKSYCHYCVVCCSPLGAPEGVAVPRVRLPMHVSILLKDGQQRSTSLHAKVLAPDDVDIYNCFGRTNDVPEFDPARTVVALPSEGAATWAQLDGLEAVDHLVLLCSPWQQVHQLAELPQVSRYECCPLSSLTPPTPAPACFFPYKSAR